MFRYRVVAAFAVVCFGVLWGTAPVARAGTLEGELALPSGGVDEPERKVVGFVGRIKNSITEPAPFDPRRDCFVYLEGGPAGDDATRTSTATLELGRSSFAHRVFPVVAGSKVDIKNTSKKTHNLATPGTPGLFGGDPIGPGGVRTGTIDTALEAIRITSKDVPHLEGRIVGLPTRYFATVGFDGSFKIEDVPAGKWTVRIWYKDGWLPVNQTVEVGGRGTTKVQVTLPRQVEPEKETENEAPEGEGKGKAPGKN